MARPSGQKAPKQAQGPGVAVLHTSGLLRAEQQVLVGLVVPGLGLVTLECADHPPIQVPKAWTKTSQKSLAPVEKGSLGLDLQPHPGEVSSNHLLVLLC